MVVVMMVGGQRDTKRVHNRYTHSIILTEKRRKNISAIKKVLDGFLLFFYYYKTGFHRPFVCRHTMATTNVTKRN